MGTWVSWALAPAPRPPGFLARPFAHRAPSLFFCRWLCCRGSHPCRDTPCSALLLGGFAGLKCLSLEMDSIFPWRTGPVPTRGVAVRPSLYTDRLCCSPGEGGGEDVLRPGLLGRRKCPSCLGNEPPSQLWFFAADIWLWGAEEIGPILLSPKN